MFRFIKKLIGEQKLYGTNYFYLVNLFGDVPLILTTSCSGKSNFITHIQASTIYEQIVMI